LTYTAALLGLLAAGPAFAQLNGRPFVVDTSITSGPGQQFYSRTAFEGANYLVVW
jgi:hypothetical protein